MFFKNPQNRVVGVKIYINTTAPTRGATIKTVLKAFISQGHLLKRTELSTTVFKGKP